MIDIENDSKVHDLEKDKKFHLDKYVPDKKFEI
jgi:hypothetical protein